MQLEYVDVVFANRPDSNTPMEGESADQYSPFICPIFSSLEAYALRTVSDFQMMDV